MALCTAALLQSVRAEARTLASPALVMADGLRQSAVATARRPGTATVEELRGSVGESDCVIAAKARRVVFDRDEWQSRLSDAGFDFVAVADILQSFRTLAHEKDYDSKSRVRLMR